MTLAPVVDLASNTITHAGTTYVMRPLGGDAFTALVDGVPVGRFIYTFGAAMGVAEAESVTEELMTQLAEAWFAAIDAQA